jgi:hypothetical protein
VEGFSWEPVALNFKKVEKVHCSLPWRIFFVNVNVSVSSEWKNARAVVQRERFLLVRVLLPLFLL